MDNLEKLRELFLIEEKDAIKCSEIVKNSNKYKLEIAGSANKDIFIESLKIREYIKINDISQVEFKNIHFKSNKNIMLFVLYLFSTNNDEYNFADFYKMFLNDSFNKNLTLNINIRIIFDNCKFEFHKEDIIFQNIIFGEKIDFIKCSFYGKLYFISTKFNCNIFLYNNIYRELLLFKNIVFYDFPEIWVGNNVQFILCFAQSIFQKDISLYKYDLKNIQQLLFSSVVFEKKIMLNEEYNIKNRKIKYLAEIEFDQVEFFEDVKFTYIDSPYGIKLTKSTFYRDVVFDKCIVSDNKLELKELIFKGEISFQNISFRDIKIDIEAINAEKGLCLNKIYQVQNGRIVDVTFESIFQKSISIKNSIFGGRFEFASCNVVNVFQLNTCEFNGEVRFDSVNFHYNFDFLGNFVKSNIHMLRCIFGGLAQFNATMFEKTININEAKFVKIPNFYSSSFSTNSAFNLNLLDVNKSSLNDINEEFIGYTSINKSISENLIPIRGMRIVFSLFKDSLLKRNDVLNASKYKLFELHSKEIELDYKLKYKKIAQDKEKITIKERFDRLFLKLNRTTSDHHTDFLKILLFTLSVIGGYFMVIFGLSFDEKIISSICDFKDLGLVAYSVSIVFFLLCLIYECLKGFNKYKILFIFILSIICLLALRLVYSFHLSEFSLFLPMIFIGILAMLFILLANNVKYTFISFAAAGFIGILCSPSIITPFLGAFSEDARNHYLYKAIDELDSQKALDLSKQILAKEPTSELNAKKILKDYKDELKSSKLLDESHELKRAVAIDGGVSRLNIAYYLVLAFCIFALQKTMRKNSIIPS